MPFDPAQPADHSDLSSQVMRNQLNALNDKIDAVPSGPPGPQGDPGPQGPPGADGEVTNAAMTDAIDSAIAGTSSNSNAVGTLDTPYGDPASEELRQKVNEIINTLRR